MKKLLLLFLLLSLKAFALGPITFETKTFPAYLAIECIIDKSDTLEVRVPRGGSLTGAMRDLADILHNNYANPTIDSITNQLVYTVGYRVRSVHKFLVSFRLRANEQGLALSSVNARTDESEDFFETLNTRHGQRDALGPEGKRGLQAQLHKFRQRIESEVAQVTRNQFHPYPENLLERMRAVGEGGPVAKTLRYKVCGKDYELKLGVKWNRLPVVDDPLGNDWTDDPWSDNE